MKSIPAIITVAGLLLFSGCAGMDSINYDSTPRQATSQVEVFKDGKMPDRKYHEIAEFIMPGKREDELIRLEPMIKAAKRLGADGLIYTFDVGGEEGGGMFGRGGGGWHQSTQWVFKGKAIVFDDAPRYSQ